MTARCSRCVLKVLQAPSVLSMSSLRAGSQISAISEDAHSHVELTDQQQLKFENIPPNIGRGSQDGETRNAIPELIHLLSDSDEVCIRDRLDHCPLFTYAFN